MAEMSSGIYSITHPKVNGCYVGQTTKFDRRWVQHRDDLAEGNHDNHWLQDIADHHGVKGFKFAILEECDRAALDHLENKWIAERGTWNIRPSQEQAKKAISKGVKTTGKQRLFPASIRFLFVMACGWLVFQFFGWAGAVVGIFLGFVAAGVG
jgi:group I intron endonuclease